VSDTALITLDIQKLSAAVTPQAVALKEAALEVAALIGKVDDAASNANAAAAQGELTKIIRMAEVARKAAKAPVLELGKAIDATMEAFTADLKQDEWRISKLVGDFHQLEEAKRKAAAEAARLEQERIEKLRRDEEMRILREQVAREAKERQEREEAERKVREAAAREQAEKDAGARAIQQAKNAAERERLAKEQAERDAQNARARELAEREAIELRRQQELAAAKTHDDLDAAQERASQMQAEVQAAPMPAPIRASGQRIAKDWDIQVTDIWLLARTHPTCVKIEPLLGEIKSLLKSGAKLSGITATEITKAGVTTGRILKAIEI
jgi:hypothetical protein